ncbi:oligopeptide ABC transporter permease [Staphylococcus pseudintermedius]|uniref:oligopeptide ABC transporter permease n=1 Tax=Staphylococcus pseudintermedius TaxID=283734 RepID=UPI000BBCC875|nr:oligopeptide ABC transporter permease [Staphylococcus pseudintermedius]EGQ1658774.1 ABC transporter permease [Staphylococcus pseudintermedius]EGQ1673386.1 ABC transporter permease [Staphylococcus pseudintermedius]EGQ1712960.1 ABC transporter permease [Staphylococcus pseudintermedius]EGQ2807791.1 ABC transporter permease [Staphylococcus pseudintermedius]EGQ2822468.1 ABC transporter permease [Staphylococcus pseudintermedius]
MENQQLKKSQSPLQIARKKFMKNKTAMAATIVLGMIVIISFLAPFIAPHDPNAQNLVLIKGDMSLEHWLGTDSGGRDIFSRLLYSGRVSLTFGLFTSIGLMLIGIVIGMISGYYGGWVDTVLMRFTEFVMLFPFIPFAVVLNATFSHDIESQYGSAIVLGTVLVLLSWVGIARMVRGKVMQEKENEYFLAAQSIGTPVHKILLKHLLPNILSVIIVQATLVFAVQIVAEAGLSFLGFGISKEVPTWGNMLTDAQEGDILRSKPWIWMPPALIITVTILCINFIGEGLKDALNPKSKR